MHYFGDTNGDLKDFIISQTGELLTVLKNSDCRYYSIHSHNDKAYFSTCINLRRNTLTSNEFNLNLMAYDTRLSTFFLEC